MMNGIKQGRNPYKKEAIKAAEELYYGEDVIEMLKNAKNDVEVERIMATARKEKL